MCIVVAAVGNQARGRLRFCTSIIWDQMLITEHKCQRLWVAFSTSKRRQLINNDNMRIADSPATLSVPFVGWTDCYCHRVYTLQTHYPVHDIIHQSISLLESTWPQANGNYNTLSRLPWPWIGSILKLRALSCKFSSSGAPESPKKWEGSWDWLWGPYHERVALKLPDTLSNFLNSSNSHSWSNSPTNFQVICTCGNLK